MELGRFAVSSLLVAGPFGDHMKSVVSEARKFLNAINGPTGASSSKTCIPNKPRLTEGLTHRVSLWVCDKPF